MLCIQKPWPGIMRTTWGDHSRFVRTYFRAFPNVYFTGDGCRKDADGDVINVAGHRLGTAEVESALVTHPAVAEAAVVGYPHEIKGQGIYAYVTLRLDVKPTEDLKKELVTDRDARRHPVGAGPAQDALGQDHAARPAQDRRERNG
jgi:acetyl-CoA synthetase